MLSLAAEPKDNVASKYITIEKILEGEKLLTVLIYSTKKSISITRLFWYFKAKTYLFSVFQILENVEKSDFFHFYVYNCVGLK